MRLPVTMTVDDYYIELCTDIHRYLYMYMLLCLTCFIIYHLCISGTQAEAMLPVVTHLSKTCEDLSMNIKEAHFSTSYIYIYIYILQLVLYT